MTLVLTTKHCEIPTVRYGSAAVCQYLTPPGAAFECIPAPRSVRLRVTQFGQRADMQLFILENY